ncbi:MAG: lytic transglycosylase domain-containing protein [Candidatus Parcubacteria bacterium]|nr:lytic transglycosylase domain-containing protein [Burkholderiales bacterium]
MPTAGLKARCALAALLALAALPARADVYARVADDGTLFLTDRDPGGATRIVASEPDSTVALSHAKAPQLSAAILAASARHGLDPLLVHAIIRVESGYDAGAVSRKGAAGLMQLMPATARRYDVADRFDPGANIEGGVRYLRDLFALFGGDQRLTLAAYNAGEGAVLRHGRRIPPYRESQAYVERVEAIYAGLIRGARVR